MKKVAIFIDWENLRKDIEKLQKHYRTTNFNYNNHQHISTLVNSFIVTKRYAKTNLATADRVLGKYMDES